MKTYLDYFFEISKISRVPGKEEKIADYLVKFAKERGLKYYRDDINNVVIWKDASVGYEDKKVLSLQSHVDMICEKTLDSKHDFINDPLDVYIDGDFVKAKDTTLGADNGVGVAYMLAILDAKDIKAPKLQCIFTVQEETTMNGARFIDETKLLGNRIISFDNFSEDEMWVSSANSKEWELECNLEYQKLNNEYNTFELDLRGFMGGHSGLDIGDESRVNPIKLAIELIKDKNIMINEVGGGSRVNIIPREFNVVFSTKESVEDIKTKIIGISNNLVQGKITLEKIEFREQAFSKELTNNIINFISSFKNGALNKDNDGNIILSGNMGAVDLVEDKIIIKCSLRANEKELGENLKQEIENNMKKNGIKVKFFDEMLGYLPENNKELAEKCARIYKEVFGKEIKKIKVQACLECGFFAEKIKDLEYISIAPNIYNAHSPDEKFSISSADRMWKYILSILQEI